VFDLADDQHRMLLVYELARTLDLGALQEKVSGGSDPRNAKEYTAKIQRENREEIEGHAVAHAEREKGRKAHFAKSPDPGLTFTLAILGNGAAASYYIEANRGKIDPIQTVVIGEANPWAGRRGLTGARGEKMHVNHPMHMITPDRSRAGVEDEALAPRDAFAAAVKAEIEGSVRFVWDSKVTSVRRVESEGAVFHEIVTEKLGKCYAQHVVVALGTGPHIEAKDKRAVNEAFARTEGADSVPRVMNLDEFQHNAARLGLGVGVGVGAPVDVFVSGGNAAIDAVTRVVRENESPGGPRFKLIWAMGGRGAQFLTGTDNEETKAKYAGHLKASNMGFRGRTTDLAVGDRKVMVTTSRVDEAASAEAKRLNPEAEPVYAKPPELIPTDYYVHGIGQDVGPILDLFMDTGKGDRDAQSTFAKSLAPTVDANFNFGPQPAPLPKDTRPEAYAAYHDEFRRTQQAISGYEARAPGRTGEAYDTGASVSFIGATASKIAGLRGEGKRHDANIAALPQDVVGNEQLAPIRAAQESQSAMTPGYVGREANFAVDNRTVIRLHIALRYPNIAPTRADMWADIIVGQRTPSADLKRRHPELVGPVPNPVAHAASRETAATYTRAFQSILERENLRG
jgi:hypothetical protein